MTTYRRLTYRLPAALEDDLVADLWAAGTLGVEVTPETPERVSLSAWFEAPDAATPDLAAIEARWRGSGVEPAGREEVAEADWLAPWRRAARPFEVGERFLLDPREPDEPPPAAAGRVLLRLPARRAFGTGSHESTRLALALLEDAFAAAGGPPPRRVLDVGTGSGVLAFAALALGAAEAVAFDLDPEAVFQARANARLNRLAPRLYAGGVAALAAVPAGDGFDLVAANVLPERLRADLTAVAGQLAAGGRLVLSGLLEEQVPVARERLAGLGLAVAAQRREGEWAAVLAAAPPDGVRG